MGSSAQSLEQLEAARNLALGDGRYYPTIIPGVLPIIGPKSAPLEVQRWGADFLAETFASPSWQPDAKVACSITVLPTLRDFIDAQDPATIKSAIQAAASIYPLVYRHMYVLPTLI
jgi:symplekin